MASELIAEAITDYFGERCLDYAEGCPTCEAWAEYDRWNTRPAPAATDTGLVTVGIQYAHEHSITGRAMWGWQKEWKGCSAIGTRELVTRSQAVELFAAERAAKDAQIAGWSESGKLWTAEIRELQADNAALTARVEELEEAIDRSEGDYWRFLHNQCLELGGACKALEAKLAAAEKALSFYADPSKWNDGYFKSEDDGTVLCAYPPSIENDQGDKARAALGGKPS